MKKLGYVLLLILCIIGLFLCVLSFLGSILNGIRTIKLSPWWYFFGTSLGTLLALALWGWLFKLLIKGIKTVFNKLKE